MQRTITIKTLLFLLFISLVSVSYAQNIETINYASGDIYVGELRNGVLNGQGTYTFADDTVSRGIWRDNELITKSDN